MIGFKSFFLIFTSISLAEILMFVKIGEKIGPAWTVLSVLATATVGVSVMRYQGFITLKKIQSQMNQGQIPGKELIEGAFLMVSGALLLTPGFLTDGIGFALLVPVIRGPLAAGLLKRGMFQMLNSGQSGFYSSTFSQESSPFKTNDYIDGQSPSFDAPAPKPANGDVIDGEYERKDE